MQYVDDILSNYYTPVIGNAIYLLIIFGLRMIFKPIKEKQKRSKISSYYDKLAAMHNFILTIESLVMCIGMVMSIKSLYNEFGSSHWGWYCDPGSKITSMKSYASYRVRNKNF